MKPNESTQSIPATGKRFGPEPDLPSTLFANLMYAAGAAVLTAGLLHAPSADPMKYVNRANRLIQSANRTCRSRDDLPSVISARLSEEVRAVRSRIDTSVSMESLKASMFQLRWDYEEGATSLICESLRSKSSSCDCQGQTACETHATECKYPRCAANRSAVPL